MTATTPTDAELVAAIDRGIATGDLIEVTDELLARWAAAAAAPAVGDLVALDSLPGYWVVMALVPATTQRPAIVSCLQDMSATRSQWAHRVPEDVTVVAPADPAPGDAERIG